MFRVVPSHIIRSADNCIYSIWYLSHRYCYLPQSWKSCNWFECAVGGVVFSCWRQYGVTHCDICTSQSQTGVRRRPDVGLRSASIDYVANHTSVINGNSCHVRTTWTDLHVCTAQYIRYWRWSKQDVLRWLVHVCRMQMEAVACRQLNINQRARDKWADLLLSDWIQCNKISR